jgi:hypothetical protein
MLAAAIRRTGARLFPRKPRGDRRHKMWRPHKPEHAMSLAVLRSRALSGMAAPAVSVEVNLANGLPGMHKVES